MTPAKKTLLEQEILQLPTTAWIIREVGGAMAGETHPTTFEASVAEKARDYLLTRIRNGELHHPEVRMVDSDAAVLFFASVAHNDSLHGCHVEIHLSNLGFI